ncbi:helix-turn-helix transcriptional regulator [Nocardia amamiensis]|uniref:Helix-turn-helix transcriptional regulator n=1 Tax=Nocardia amamiensis TaxID=404578 RepID=A0ABS0CPV4_9NOCA|nr:helix-turn-helix transcriptional regulator [Nocardia amamiensis]MBF6297828.1 helix-turn-helix transcriptional regulator [Nocardia amamiensis]
MTTTAKEAREAFGERLRNLRKDAGLTGRQLAELAGWHSSKVSKIEYGKQTATEEDLRTWCIHTSAADQIPDLIANLRNVETAYLEQKRMRLPHRQKQSIATEAKANLMRWYEPVVVPGLLQTPPYAEAILRMVLDFYEDPPGDLDPGLAARLERQQVLYRGNHRFYFIIAEQVLHTPVGTADVMLEQLDRLLTAMSLPRVVLGILPTEAAYRTPVMNNFIMFDSRMVQVETISAELTITQPSEIVVYERAFHRLKDQAIHGQDARAMIAAAMDELRDS